MLEDWDIAPGTVTTRREVQQRYGGSMQGGIQPSATSSNVMIYSDPGRGQSLGYNFDGWAQHEPAYYYTGEGQIGDQEVRAGNRAIVEHAATGRTLRVFEAASGKQSGGVLQTYVGAFAVDPADPYRQGSVKVLP